MGLCRAYDGMLRRRGEGREDEGWTGEEQEWENRKRVEAACPVHGHLLTKSFSLTLSPRNVPLSHSRLLQRSTCQQQDAQRCTGHKGWGPWGPPNPTEDIEEQKAKRVELLETFPSLGIWDQNSSALSPPQSRFQQRFKHLLLLSFFQPVLHACSWVLNAEIAEGNSPKTLFQSQCSPEKGLGLHCCRARTGTRPLYAAACWLQWTLIYLSPQKSPCVSQGKRCPHSK